MDNARSRMDPSILYEDDALLVIDKPSGMVVTNSDTVGSATVEDWVQHRWGSDLPRGGIVHRLDKDTSGCLIVAKTDSALVELQHQFKAREVSKEYMAVVYGRLEPEAGTIRVPLARSHDSRERFTVDPRGKIAETSYRVKKVFIHDDQEFTLVTLYPKTGRTHQIRVHLLYFRHPIVGDKKYAGQKRVERTQKFAPRMLLHASQITFFHPLTKQKTSVFSPLPRDFRQALHIDI